MRSGSFMSAHFFMFLEHRLSSAHYYFLFAVGIAIIAMLARKSHCIITWVIANNSAILLELAKDSSESVWKVDPKFHFSGKERFNIRVKSTQKEINLEEELGLSINIPENSFYQTVDIDITIITTFRGQFQMPDNVDFVSPIFCINFGIETELGKDLEVKIQHNAYIKSKENYKQLVLLEVPDYGRSDNYLQYKLKVVKEAKLEMVPKKRNYALVKIKKNFSCFGLGMIKPASKPRDTQ